MATTISGTNGVSQVQDGIVTDGKLDLTANSVEVKESLNASGTAPIYACRAWVNFDGTGTVSITASGNVSSITDNGTGDYTVNFATAMEDANYVVTGTTDEINANRGGVLSVRSGSTVEVFTTSVRVFTMATGGNLQNASNTSVSIFR